MERVNTPERIFKYFNPSWDKDKSLPLATVNGSFGIMTIVQSEDYPVAAGAIKDLFRLTPQAAKNPGISPQGNVMLQLPGEIDKESKTKKGIIKLVLLHIRGDIDINSMLITNVNLATPSKGMQLFLNQPRAARAGQFADLMQMTLDLAKQQDYTNIQSLQVSIRVMSKVLATHMLQGNFTTEKVTSLEIEANLIEPSAFPPQKNASLMEHKRNDEIKAM
jgi:hypothetical protein